MFKKIRISDMSYINKKDIKYFHIIKLRKNTPANITKNTCLLKVKGDE